MFTRLYDLGGPLEMLLSEVSFNSFGEMKKGNLLSHGRQKREKPFVLLRMKLLHTDCAGRQTISPNHLPEK